MGPPEIWHQLSASTKDTHPFRLLRIWPGQGSDDRLVVGLSEERLQFDDAGRHPAYCNVPFEAISYSWGDGSDTVAIECNGTSVRIGRNLDQALRTFRLPDRPRAVWADALCINQADETEKHQQLKLMGFIYLQAQRVLVYLGPNAHREADAFPLCRYLYATAWNLGQAGVPQHAFLSALQQSTTARAGPMRVGRVGQTRALRALFSLPYFTRVWTLQEVYLNANVLFHCGGFTLEFMPLMYALVYVASSMVVFTRFEPQWVHVMSFMDLLSRKDDHHKPVELLDIVRPQRCLEPRDKVYALSMILRHLDRKDPLVPRPEDVGMVFTRAAVHFIQAEQSLDFLCKAGLSQSALRELPSWVPDWDHPDGAYQFSGTVWRRQVSSRPTKSRPFWCEWRETRTLAVHGMVLSVISAVTDTMPEQLEYLAGQPISIDESTGSIKLNATLYQRHIESLVQYEPLLQFAEDTQHLAQTPTDTWRVLSAYDPSYARCKGWSDSLQEWNQLYDAFAENVRRWARSVRKGRHKGFKLYAETMRSFMSSHRRKQIDHPFWDRLSIHGRRLARDDAGRLINAPAHAKVGDCVALLVGGSVPFIVRRRGAHYVLVGDSYIGGIMHGEAWDEAKCSELILV